jgi:hypothetical protein
VSAGALTAGRRAAERRMKDTCTIRRVTGSSTDDDGVVTPTLDVVYVGKCKVQVDEGQEANPEAGGHTFTIQRLRVDLPVARTVEDYKPLIGDIPTIDTAHADPHLAGQEYRVVKLLHKTEATAYRLAVTNEADS